SARDGLVANVTEQGSLAGQPVAAPAGRPLFVRVLRDQRKTIGVAVVLSVAAFWVLGQLGEWTLAASLVVGVVLGLLNHLAIEYWGLRVVSSAAQLTRHELGRSTPAA